MNGELEERASHSHVGRTFGHVEAVRSRIFELPSSTDADPCELEPLRELTEI